MENFKLNSGYEIPALGYGTFQMTSAEVEAHVPEAIAQGYTHIDTANAYFNEVAVGKAIKASGAARADLFVTSKLFPQDYPYEKCAAAIDATLERLGLDYLDLMLFHQPYGDYVEGWRAMEEAVRSGKVRSIGLSNFSATKVKEVLDVAQIEPAVMQILINPYWNAHEYKRQIAELGIEGVVYEGWYPLGHGNRAMMNEPVFAELAQKYGKSNAQVMLRWHFQEGNVVFPKTLNPAHMAGNIDIFDFELTDEEMARVNALEQDPQYVVPDEAPEWVWGPNDYTKQA
jgi:diketogulonate reductase-like aldo/keto reductase